MKNKLLLGHFLALICIIFWGTTFVSTKVLLNHLMPIEIMLYRFVLGYIVLFLIKPEFKRIKSWKDEFLLFCAGIFGIAVYFLFENLALNISTASNVGLLISFSPVSTAILAHFLTKDEKFAKNLLFGFIIAITGIFFILFNGNFVLKLNPLGDIFALLAGITWSFYLITLKRIGNDYGYVYLTRKIFFYGILASLPIVFITKPEFSLAKLLLPMVWPNVLFLGLVASAFCYFMWNVALHILGTVKVSSYIYLLPLVSMLTSAILLKEKITVFMVLGSLLILTGTYISENGFKLPVKKISVVKNSLES